MRRHVLEYIVVGLLLAFGLICLKVYGIYVYTVYQKPIYPIYIIAAIAITLALYQLVYFIECSIRRVSRISYPFAKIIYFLIPSVFLLNHFYVSQDSSIKLGLAIAALALAFFVARTFGVAITNTAFATRRTKISYSVLSIIVFFCVLSILTENIELFLLLPLSLMILYTAYLRFNFFQSYDRSYHFRSIWATGLVSIIFVAFLIVGLLTVNTVSWVYDVGIRLYLPLLGVILAPSARARFRNKITKQQEGLVQLLLFFISASLFGRFSGVELDGSFFVQGLTLLDILGDPSSILMFIRILSLDFVVISFPIALIYFYAYVKKSYI